MNHFSILSLPIDNLRELGERRVLHPSPAGTPGERRAALGLALLAVLMAAAAALLG